MKVTKIKINCIKLKDMRIKLLEVVFYESSKQIYSFKIFKTRRSFGDSL